jgi:type III secretory pathway component EscV
VPTTSPETASLTLFLGESSPLDRDALAREFSLVQSIIFQGRGVIPPAIAIRTDARLRGDALVLAINEGEPRLTLPPGGLPAEADPGPPLDVGSNGPPLDGDSRKVRELVKGLQPPDIPPGPIADALFRIGKEIWEKAAELLSTELVEHYLLTLESTYPDLIRAVRPPRYTLADLTRILQSKLSPDDTSIRNLPAVLEQLLAPDRWKP